MTYIGTTINESPTITGAAVENLKDAVFTAAKFDENGLLTPSGAGEAAIGLIVPDAGIASPTEAVVQVKDIGRWKAGGAFSAGTMLASDANGAAVTAVEGDFILAQALTAVTLAGNVATVQIIKAGKA